MRAQGREIAAARAEARATKVLDAAQAAQERLAETDSPGPVLGVRMGPHLGEAVERGGDHFGPTVNLTARLEADGHQVGPRGRSRLG